MAFGHLGPNLVQLLQVAILAEHLNGLIEDANDATGVGPKAWIGLQ